MYLRVPFHASSEAACSHPGVDSDFFLGDVLTERFKMIEQRDPSRALI